MAADVEVEAGWKGTITPIQIVGCWVNNTLSRDRFSALKLNKSASRLDATTSKCMPPPDAQRTDGRRLMRLPQPENRIRPRRDLDFWPVTLKTFPAVCTHVMNIHAEFHRNPSTNWRDIASREMGVNGRTDKWPENNVSCAYCCWRRHNNHFVWQKIQFCKNALPGMSGEAHLLLSDACIKCLGAYGSNTSTGAYSAFPET